MKTYILILLFSTCLMSGHAGFDAPVEGFQVGIIEAGHPGVQADSIHKPGLQEYFINLYDGSAGPGGRPLPGVLAAVLFGAGALFLSRRRKTDAESSQS